ncbi:MAG: 4-hydroxythreonine-4-phosphate dehydrogenase [Pelagibacteraceae bacterium TMED201]|nr:4-hydroxythreonine-4-phosphate dehydrogenase PdxA [Pelagibacterales bacterium SAG-MED30]OUW63748.1 MAG: 4-hydroxythreonine-4-phosphate dehydrogenase [Pelagibacteraceae bacterium TMED201]
MKIKPILLVAGEPKSVFIEIFFKSIKNIKYKSPLILICSKRELKNQIKKFKFNKKIRILDKNNIKNLKINNKKINLIDVSYEVSNNRKLNIKLKNEYINNCFNIAFRIIKSGYTHKFINGPINKKTFLNKKFLGITEYVASKFDIKETGMLIYNNEISVCPLTTHLPLKLVPKKITKKLIENKIKMINDFFKKKLKLIPMIGVTGLNPHCESINKFNEDEKIVAPAIKSSIKKKIKVKGPFSADTIFLKTNRNKFNVILGMYHDQVLAPLKTLFEYNAINITMGLPFFRVSPDHGPNEKMFGKNKSNPKSLIQALKFLDKK